TSKDLTTSICSLPFPARKGFHGPRGHDPGPWSKGMNPGCVPLLVMIASRKGGIYSMAIRFFKSFSQILFFGITSCLGINCLTLLWIEKLIYKTDGKIIKTKNGHFIMINENF